jgi:hypothetical protein
MKAVRIVIGAAFLVFAAWCLGGGFVEGFQMTFGPFPEPVRYSWESGKKCVVIYPDKREVPCTKFTKEELNQFRLEYTDPHRIPKE